MKPQELSLNCEIFDEFRDRLDKAITIIMRNMVSKGIHAGSITGKIKIELSQTTTDDGEIIYMPKIKPAVNLKLSAKGDIECGVQDGFLMKPDGNDGFVIGTSQVSMDELMEEQREGA